MDSSPVQDSDAWECSNIALLLMDSQPVSAFMFIVNSAKITIPVYISSVEHFLRINA